MALVVPSHADYQLFTLLQSYSGCPLVSLDVNASVSAPELRIGESNEADGNVIRGRAAALRYLASQSPRAEQLLGGTNEARCKIAEILSLAGRGIWAGRVLDGDVAALDGWLAGRTYVAGVELSVADLVLFVGLSGVVGSFPVAQHGHFCNVLRWYENVWYLVGGEAEGFVDVARVVRKPGLVMVGQGGEVKGQKKGQKKGEKGEKGEKEKEGGNAKEAKKKEKDGGNAKEAKEAKEEAKTKKKAADGPKKPPKKTDMPKEDPTVDYLDIRVGKIVEVGPHPDADSLYVEKIDLGEAEPRTVVSGLRKFVSEADMLNRTVAVVCNLKPAKMRGILSTGMVLCASNEDHTAVDPILIPEGSTVGSRIMVEGYGREAEEQINPKKKIFERVAPDMRVGGGTCV